MSRVPFSLVGKKKGKAPKIPPGSTLLTIRNPYPTLYRLTDEGPMDIHTNRSPFCVYFSWCACQPTIIDWNALTRQRTYKHKNYIH